MPKTFLPGLLIAIIISFSHPALAASCIDTLDKGSGTPVEDLHNCFREIEGALTELESLRSRVADAEANVDALASKKASWPSGKYGIFKYGDCPPNFRAVTGHMFAIVMHGITNPQYLKPESFGDTVIRPHNNGATGKHSDFVLSLCMKDH